MQQRNIRASLSEEQRQTEKEKETRDVCCKGEKNREREEKKRGTGKEKGLRRRREREQLLQVAESTWGHCQALKFPSEPLNCCHNEKVSLPPLVDYPSLKDLFTGSNTAESTSGSTTVPSPFLHLN